MSLLFNDHAMHRSHLKGSLSHEPGIGIHKPTSGQVWTRRFPVVGEKARCFHGQPEHWRLEFVLSSRSSVLSVTLSLRACPGKKWCAIFIVSPDGV